MGEILKINCKCSSDHNKSRTYYLGSGMFTFMQHNEIIRKIKLGKYGKEYKEIVDKKPYCVVDINKSIFICPKCKSLKSECVFNLYAPKHIDINKIKNNQCYYDFFINRHNYTLMKERIHLCSNCETKMNRISIKELQKMNCPRCGEKYIATVIGDWD